MAKFTPGHKKTGGRGPGSKNKTTEEIRRLIKDFLSNNWESLQSDFDKLKPEGRCKFRSDLMRFVLYIPVAPEKFTMEQLQELYEQFKKMANEQE